MHRTFAALALAALLTAAPSGLYEPLWNVLTRAWAENGFIIDPNGLTGDNGCVIDPDGRCRPDPGTSSLTGDNGCQVDPNGRCIG